jgi:hypothetical protein
MKWLIDIDIFGEEIKMYLNKNTKIQTKQGGIFTMIMICLVFTFAWLIGNDLIYKVNPFSYSQTSIYRHYPKIEIDNNNFPFSILITNQGNIPVNFEKYLTLSLVYSNFRSNNGKLEPISYAKLKFIKCEPEHYPTLTQEEFDSFLSSSFCPEKQNFTLQGYWSEDILSYVSARVLMCDLQANKSECKSKDEIVKFIQKESLNLNIQYLDNQVNVKNYNSPVSYFPTTNVKYFNSDKSNIINWMVQREQMVTDKGMIFTFEETHQFLRVVETQSQVSDYTDSYPMLFAINFYPYNKYEIFYRKYIKLTEILASLGGLIKLFSAAFMMLNLGFSRLKKYHSIMNQLFNINLEEIEKDAREIIRNSPKKIQIKESHKIDLNNNESNVYINFPKYNVKPLPNFTLEENEIVKVKAGLAKTTTKVLNLSNLEKCHFLLNDLCNSTRKSLKKKGRWTKFDIYSQAVIQIKSYFDMSFIIKKLEEFELIKEIFVSKDQIYLFDILSKPIIPRVNVQNRSLKEDLPTSIIKLHERMRKNVYERSYDKFLDYCFIEKLRIF